VDVVEKEKVGVVLPGSGSARLQMWVMREKKIGTGHSTFAPY
jgi:hypothetical protein